MRTQGRELLCLALAVFVHGDLVALVRALLKHDPAVQLDITDVGVALGRQERHKALYTSVCG